MIREPDPDVLDRADDDLLALEDRAELLGYLDRRAEHQRLIEARDRAWQPPDDDPGPLRPDYMGRGATQ